MAAHQYTHGKYGWSRTVTAAELRADYEGAAMSTAEMGRKYGVSDTTIIKTLQRYGIARRRQGHNGDCARGARNPHWKGRKVGYTAAHDRVRRARGTPAVCEDCPKQGGSPRGYHWANLTGRYWDLEDYRRLCAKCHRTFDKSRLARGSRNGATKLTGQEVRTMRMAYKAGATVLQLHRKFGVDRKTIYDLLRRKTWAHVA